MKYNDCNEIKNRKKLKNFYIFSSVQKLTEKSYFYVIIFSFVKVCTLRTYYVQDTKLTYPEAAQLATLAFMAQLDETGYLDILAYF